MPRRPRVIVPGVAHHVTQRGNNRQQIFFSAGDHKLYLDLLAKYAERCGTRIVGYCLMTNHIHLVVVPEQETSLARTLGRTHSEYALALNKAVQRSGHLWQNRFFSCPLDESHLLTALRYVDLNPVRAGLVAQPCDWPWSSSRAHSFAAPVDPVLHRDWSGCFRKWNYTGWQECLQAEVLESECDALRLATHTGEPLGPRQFVTQLERQAGRRLRVLPRGRPPKAPPSLTGLDCQESLFGVG